MTEHELLPAPVSERGLAGGGADDVGEQHRRQHALELDLLLAELADESNDLVGVRLGVLRHHDRCRAGHDAMTSTRDEVGHGTRLRGHLPTTAEYERRHADRREDVPCIGLVVHAECRRGVPGPCRLAHEVEVPLHEVVVLDILPGDRARIGLGRRPGAPAATHLRQLALELLRPHAPRVVGRPRDAGSCVGEREGHCALGVGGGEERGERATVGKRGDHRTIAPGGVEYDPHVVHSLLERGEAWATKAIRESLAAVVEADQTAERCKPFGLLHDHG